MNKAEQVAQKNNSKNIWKFQGNFRGQAQNSPARCKLIKYSRDSRFINIYIRLKTGEEFIQSDFQIEKLFKQIPLTTIQLSILGPLSPSPFLSHIVVPSGRKGSRFCWG